MLPGTDETLYVVSQFREALEPYVRVGVPEVEAVDRALDKRVLAAESARVGVPTPEGRICEQPEEALAAAAEFGFPVMVKGVRTIVSVDGRVVRFASHRVSNEAELRALQARVGACIVQQVVEGTLLSFGGVMSDDGLIGIVLSRHRRTWPPLAGNASFSQTIEPAPELTKCVEKLVDGLGWRGLFQLEMIETNDGTTKAIDFNPRPYGSMGLAEPSGAPLASLWCALLLGEHPSPATARAGVLYRWEDADIRHIVWQARQGNVRQAAAALLPQRRAVHAFLRARDSFPFVARLIELIQVRWRRATAKVGSNR
ncbi:MAG: ATP-grasp domain-containing protein [Solirubrobacterales bacterium]|nr:ATP-grasp domain-containing protein [Solirubrobacterales bacterium]